MTTRPALLAVLAVAAGAHAADPQSPVPKSQQSVLEALEKVAARRAEAEAEANPLKQREAVKAADAEGKVAAERFNQTLTGHGLKGWVGVVTVERGFLGFFSDDGRLVVRFHLDTLPESVRQSVRELGEGGAAARVEVAAIPKAIPATLDVDGTLKAVCPGEAVKSVTRASSLKTKGGGE